jgi:hypothetical protein
MDVTEKFVSMPFVTKNNKDEDIKAEMKINPRHISSYYEAGHIHEGGDITLVTYVYMLGSPDILGFPIPISDFEERLIPYLPIINSEGRIEYVFKSVPIRFKDVKKSELYGRPMWVDEVCNFNFGFMNYWHPAKAIYDEKDGEVDVIWFGVAGNFFTTLLSVKEFKAIIENNNG